MRRRYLTRRLQHGDLLGRLTITKSQLKHIRGVEYFYPMPAHRRYLTDLGFRPTSSDDDPWYERTDPSGWKFDELPTRNEIANQLWVAMTALEEISKNADCDPELRAAVLRQSDELSALYYERNNLADNLVEVK